MRTFFIIPMVFLFCIAWSDFRRRLIPVAFLLVTVILTAFEGFYQNGFFFYKTVLINSCILAIQVTVLLLWIKLRNNTEENLWTKFGEGDLFMMIIAASSFSLLNYLLFTIFISLFAVFVWTLILTTGRLKNLSLPFAGFLAAGLLMVKFFQFTSQITPYSDFIVLNLIYGLH